MTALPLDPGALQTPALARRLTCFVYEGVLLFGVVTIAGLAYGVLTDQRHALVGLHGLQVAVFAVLALYFTWFWSRAGQTLAMQTWRIRVLTRDGRPLTRVRAFCRFLASWLWFLPGLAIVSLAGLHGGGPVFGTVIAWVLVYGAMSRWVPERQFVHDWLCGTRLVAITSPPGPRRR